MATSVVIQAWPRGLSAERAAAYVGLSEQTLAALVAKGDAPNPVWLSPGRKVWLREDLDAWLDRKAGRSQNDEGAAAWMKAL